jgi:hypothetical protein
VPDDFSRQSWRRIALKAPRTTDGQLFVKIAFAGLASHDQLMFRRNRHAYADSKRIAASLMLLRFLYRHLAANHVIAEALELSGLSADKVLDLVGFSNLPETHLQR